MDENLEEKQKTMSEKLEDIGFYTLTDWRAKNSSKDTPLHRCEMLLTNRCNFNCPYCRGSGPDTDLSLEEAKRVVDIWTTNKIRNIRLSGGEPTVWPHLLKLVEYIIEECDDLYHLAISTNGSADQEFYEKLINAGALISQCRWMHVVLQQVT